MSHNAISAETLATSNTGVGSNRWPHQVVVFLSSILFGATCVALINYSWLHWDMYGGLGGLFGGVFVNLASPETRSKNREKQSFDAETAKRLDSLVVSGVIPNSQTEAARVIQYIDRLHTIALSYRRRRQLFFWFGCLIPGIGVIVAFGRSDSTSAIAWLVDTVVIGLMFVFTARLIRRRHRFLDDRALKLAHDVLAQSGA